MKLYKNIPWYEWHYEVSNSWEVFSIKFWKKKELSRIKNKEWYLVVWLCKDWKVKIHRIHRLVAELFLEKIDWLYDVNHKDWNRENNNDWNLEWCDDKMNILHAHYILWKDWWNKKRKVVQYSLSWDVINEYASINLASRVTNICASSIRQCCIKNSNFWWFVWRFSNTSIEI